MTSTTTGRRRFAAQAAAFAAIATIGFGAAACGTETASDNGSQPAAPAQVAPQAGVAPHAPMSADSAEREGAAQDRIESVVPPGGHRPVALP